MNATNTCKPAFVWIGLACLLTCPENARAQSTSSNPPTQTQSAASVTSVATGPRPAKVWTNEDIDGLRGQSTVSTVGSTSQKPRASAKSSQTGLKDRRAKSYQSEIARLRAELPPIEHQIADLEAALSGNPINSARRYSGVRPDDWTAQLQSLKKRRDEILGRISGLEDDARRQAVPANALP